MLQDLEILLRTGQAPYTVAHRLGAALGYRVVQQVNRRMVLKGALSENPRDGLSVPVDSREIGPDDGVFGGYDIALTLNPTVYGVDEQEEESLALRFFDSVCRALGLPTLLTSSYIDVVAAWSPELGPRRFPADTYSGESGRALWQPYELPVAVPVTIAAEDRLAQLYQQILTQPATDEPRLAYAEVVESEHPEYATLIREQIAQRRDRIAGVEWPAARSIALIRLERELHRAIVPFRDFDVPDQSFRIRRGFLETIAVEARRLPRVIKRFAGGFPLRMLYLTGGAEDRIDELGRSPLLPRLVGLSFWGNKIGDDGLRRFLQSPQLTGLRWLDVARAGVTEAGLEALAASGAVPNLRYVQADEPLYPTLATDYDGTPVAVSPSSSLTQRLAQRYDGPWLHWAETELGRRGIVPDYDEV